MSNTEHLKKIQEIYIAYYGRPADPEGLEAWAAVLEEAGGDVDAIIDSFATSPEAEVRFGGLSSAEMITQLYNQLFGRDPESQQIIDAWVFQLENNPDVTLQSISLDILSGARDEDAETISNRLAAAQAFTDEIATNDTDGVYRGNLAAAIASDWLSNIHENTGDLENALNSVRELVSSLSVAFESEELSPGSLEGDRGFTLTPAALNSDLKLVGAGDFNGDGFDDVLIGAPREDLYTTNHSGESYLIFGGEEWSAEFDITSLDGSNGFALIGLDSGDRAGYSVSSAGDINGDGFDDLLIGAPKAQRVNGSKNPDDGDSYVVFGTDDTMAPIFDLEQLNGSNGFRIGGDEIISYSGRAVSSAGDINGDGFDDLMISSYAGAHVIFGHSGIWGTDGESYALPHVELSSLDGSNGFTLFKDIEGSDNSYAISEAGDINGDGYSDIVVGLQDADHDGLAFAGEAYVLFGHEGDWDAQFNLAELDGKNGFMLGGLSHYDALGISVSSAGDVNGDGYDDLSIGADGNSHYYVIFGHGGPWSDELAISDLNGANGFSMAHKYWAEIQLTAGDVNNDGFSDLLVSDMLRAGTIVYGHNGYWPESIELETPSWWGDLDSESPVANHEFIGDINGDGFEDISGAFLEKERESEYWFSGQILFGDSLLQ